MGRHKFFKKFYLKSDTKYEGPLNEPTKNVSYFINLIGSKLHLIYLKIFNNNLLNERFNQK